MYRQVVIHTLDDIKKRFRLESKEPLIETDKI